MYLKLPVEIAEDYSSGSQRIRVMTEEWVNRSGFCPNCGSVLSQFENNKPVADFYCGNCSEEYELKSKHGEVGKKIVDGAYATQPLIDGIEALRFEYGIDSTGDGSPDSYLPAPPTALDDLRNTVAVKVHVLARNLEATPGYKDIKSYQLGNAATISAANDGFKRHVFSTTVRLVNPSGRREVP